MKIQRGRYILTNKDQIEKLLDQQDAENALLRAQLNLVQQWAKDQLSIHQPYTRAIDLSCHQPDHLIGALGNKLKQDIWCARCSNPWPCKHIAQLRIVREIAGRNDLGTLADLAEKMKAFEPPVRRDGQIDVLL